MLPGGAGALFANVSLNGVPIVSRIGRFMMHDKSRVAAHFDTLAARKDVDFIVVAHGDVVEQGCAAAFAACAASLR